MAARPPGWAAIGLSAPRPRPYAAPVTGPEDPFGERPADQGAPPGYRAAYGPPAYGPPAYGPPGYGPPPPGQRQAATGAAGYGPPQGQGQPGWGPPPGAVQETSSRAIVALVLAVCSFVVFPFVPAVVALFVAPQARRELAAARGRLGGEGLVRAAVVVAWVNIALSLVVLLALAGLVTVALTR
jgi:hypothetical protein